MSTSTLLVSIIIGAWIAFLVWRVVNAERYRPEDDPMYKQDFGDRE